MRIQGNRWVWRWATVAAFGLMACNEVGDERAAGGTCPGGICADTGADGSAGAADPDATPGAIGEDSGPTVREDAGPGPVRDGGVAPDPTPGDDAGVGPAPDGGAGEPDSAAPGPDGGIDDPDVWPDGGADDAGSGSDGGPDDVDPGPDVDPECGPRPAPENCFEVGCPEGETCVPSGDDRCVPSSCTCAGGAWSCTRDCNGGVCLHVGCSAIYDPVCGEDGRTYPNACEAAAAGVRVVHEGPCSSAEPCDRTGACPDGQVCQDGVCVACPDRGDVRICLPCEEGYVQVGVDELGCPGCRCEPHRECEVDADCPRDGVCVGAGLCLMSCAAGDPSCCEGSVCRPRDPGDRVCEGPNPAGCTQTGCPDGQRCEPSVLTVCAPSECFCDSSTGEWACTDDCMGGGTCVGETPRVCSDDRPCPIGMTCMRGLCYPADPVCESSRDCPDGMWCVRGQCIEPAACPGVYDPVCGVDGVTYGNACEAAARGVAIAYAGECRGGAEPVRCRSNADCGERERCNLRTNTCVPVCEFACLIPDPVCGADGRTYVCGAAEAECNGTTVVHEGPCRRAP